MLKYLIYNFIDFLRVKKKGVRVNFLTICLTNEIANYILKKGGDK